METAIMESLDCSRVLHGIFTTGVLSSFDWVVGPSFLLHLDPIMETYAFFRSLAFFQLVMSCGFVVGVACTTTRMRKIVHHMDLFMLVLCPVFFLLWTLCTNPSMFVMVKLLEGTLLGYFSQSFPLIGQGFDQHRFHTHIAGSSVSIVIVCFCFQPSFSFRRSVLFAGSLLLLFTLLINAVQGLFNVLRVSTRVVMQPPPATPTPLKPTEPPLVIVPTIDPPVPGRYHRGCGEEAAERWRQTCAWRRDNRIDSLLAEEQPQFELIKVCYPSYFHGRSKMGYPVIYEQLGSIDLKRLKANGIDKTILLRHYLFHIEYLWNTIEPSDEGQAITIMDIKNVQVYDIMGDVLDFLKITSQTIQQHYVERCHKIFIVNTPLFFHMIWSAVSPLIHENTRKKISILGSDVSELSKHIDADVIPLQYGGSDSTPLGQHNMERELLNYVRTIKNKSSQLPKAEPVNGMKKAVRLPIPGDREPWLLEQNPSRTDLSELGDEADDSFDWERVGAFAKHTLKVLQKLALPQLVNSKGVPMKQEKVEPIIENIRREAVQAHLGIENAFKYDPVLKRWKLENTDLEALNSFDESEKDIIRAIEAAHERRQLGLDSTRVEWKKCDRHFIYMLCIYFIWRAQLSSVVYGLTAILPLAFDRGGYGMQMQSFGVLLLISMSAQCMVTTVPVLLKRLNLIDRPLSFSTSTIRCFSQFQGVAVGIITLFAIINRSFKFGIMTSTIVLAFCLSTVHISSMCSLLGTAELFSIANMSKECINMFCFSADSFGIMSSFFSLSIVFGDSGISKHNAYVAVPFLVATMVISLLTHIAMQEIHPIYAPANFLSPPSNK